MLDARNLAVSASQRGIARIVRILISEWLLSLLTRAEDIGEKCTASYTRIMIKVFTTGKGERRRDDGEGTIRANNTSGDVFFCSVPLDETGR